MKYNFQNLCVVGLGYIGLPTAATFAANGLKVTGVDINTHAVNMINQGRVHIVEPDLDALVKEVVEQGNLIATDTPVSADAFIVAVPTPFTEKNEPDLKYIEAASKALAPYLKTGNLVILESTSPVGATEQMSAWLSEARPDLSFPQNAGEDSDIMVAHCPERVLPGRVLEELVSNDRIVGGMTNRCSQAACDLYTTFVQGQCLTTNARTAEMCKLTENSFRDVNIAFANELSLICDKLDINAWELISLANHHPRVNILQPGPGVGGHCIAVDPWFIVASSPDEARLIRTAREVNDYKPDWVVSKVNEEANRLLVSNEKKVKDIVVKCYGLAFKPDIDDLRESPALSIIDKLLEQGYKVIAIEPNIDVLPNKYQDKLVLCDLYNNEVECDIHLILVNHSEFKGYFNKHYINYISENSTIIDIPGVLYLK